ncbi:hypothetical protein, partial [Citrobacter youngae]|uniref:hypothetical protein n=1 Tax=Citrobacter youngae TaxID=133448 RepID=UPI001953FE12
STLSSIALAMGSVKIISFLATFIIILTSASQYSFADDISTRGKVIFIDMNRTSMSNMLRLE